jgi:hypothetical protein
VAEKHPQQPLHQRVRDKPQHYRDPRTPAKPGANRISALNGAAASARSIFTACRLVGALGLMCRAARSATGCRRGASWRRGPSEILRIAHSGNRVPWVRDE